MKKKSVRLMHLTGELADVVLLSVVYDYESALQDDSYRLYENEVIIDAEANVYAHRPKNEEWRIVNKARENQDTFREVLKMTVITVMVERRN